MQIARTQAEMADIRARSDGTIAFVPTMGALHEGHLSLVKLAKEHADTVIFSIFVNPTQFAPHEDFDSYPRNYEQDIKQLKSEGVDIIYLPTEDDIYPGGDREQWVPGGEAARGLETDFRPHFFDGVLNVVHRLFKQVKPNVAIFGEKDYQQLMVIKDSVEFLDIPVEIIGAPITRDNHGLALSSRNAYLSEDALKIARKLNVILKDTANTDDLESAKKRLLESGFDKIDYIEKRWGRILVAVWLGKNRLIDNCTI